MDIIKRLCKKITENISDNDIKWFVIITLIALLTMLYAFASNTMYVKAESPQNALPYNIHYHADLNTMLSNELIDAMMNFANANNVLPSTFNQDNMVIWMSDYNTSQGWYYVNVACDVYCQTSVTVNTDYTTSSLYFATNYISPQNKNTTFRFQFKYNNGTISGWGTSQYYNSRWVFLGSPNTITTDIGTYTTNYPAYFTGDAIKYNDDVEVIIMKSAPIIDFGKATEPNEFESPQYPNGTTAPSTVPPSFTVNNYTWNTYNSPSIDTTNVESLLESLIDVINYLAGWLSSNLSGEFANLTSNIQGFFNYIGQTIQYYGDLIVSNIQNGIETFYNNMVSLFEPIAENIQGVVDKITEIADYISNPWDEEEFEETLENSDFYQEITSQIDSWQTFYSAMENIDEPDHFSIYYTTGFHPDVEVGGNVLPTIEGEISFDWLYPLRTTYRPFIWLVTLYYMFIYASSNLSGALLGHNSKG